MSDGQLLLNSHLKIPSPSISRMDPPNFSKQLVYGDWHPMENAAYPADFLHFCVGKSGGWPVLTAGWQVLTKI